MSDIQTTQLINIHPIFLKNNFLRDLVYAILTNDYTAKNNLKIYQMEARLMQFLCFGVVKFVYVHFIYLC